MKTFFKIPLGGTRQQGFSIVEALLAIGVIGVVAVGIASGISYSKRSQKSLEIKQSSTQFQESFRGAIGRVVRKFMTEKCVGTSSYGCAPPPPGRGVVACAITIEGGGGGGTADMPDPGGSSSGGGGSPSISGKSPTELFFTDVPLGGGAMMSYTENVTPLAPDQQAAAARCANPMLGDAANGRLGNGEFYRFCVSLKPPTNKSFSNDSFWSQSGAFAEIIIVPVRLTTDDAMLCRDVTSGGEGAKVIYSVHFASKQGSTRSPNGTVTDLYTSKRNNGVFYVSSQ
jgi:hypothetical protein